jgi:predicted Fe-Mo cluster-binding NifX family protein
MTKVAIPIFLDRISPRLDCARRMLILHIEKNRLLDKREMDISHWEPDEKITQLRHMGIEQVICGGLRLEDRIHLNRFGIRVASPIFGEIDTVIDAFLKGALRWPGCPCPRRQRRRNGLE